ncbi:MAG TPA: hydrogenase expression/formation C-terminal domain-containing protein [Thiohalobacter sp.]|nr:hydrogenase expression/formation C-terminal domain-containing protein [Thiohalobacter sp.]
MASVGGLSDIPVVTTEGIAPDAGVTPAVQALLTELAESLEAFRRTGNTHVIDLRSLPIRLEEHALLRDWLGVGEVTVEIDSLGLTSIHETAYPGIWWVIHRNREGEIMTQQVEVTRCPALIHSQPEDIDEAAARLRAALTHTGEMP